MKKKRFKAEEVYIVICEFMSTHEYQRNRYYKVRELRVYVEANMMEDHVFHISRWKSTSQVPGTLCVIPWSHEGVGLSSLQGPLPTGNKPYKGLAPITMETTQTLRDT